jgi:hypothetical protein
VGVLRYSIVIDALPSVVWRLWADIDRIPEWQTGSPRIGDVSGPGHQVGTVYTVRRGPLTSRTTVVIADPPSRYGSYTDALLGLQLSLAADMIPEGQGTRVSIEATTRWPRGLGLFGRAVEAALLSEREALRELAQFKALVERESGGR